MTQTASMLLIADRGALQPAQKVWGTGGWLMPEEREALDWLTLGRLSGWDVTIATPDLESLKAAGTSAYRWVVIACDPEVIGEELVTLFRRWLVKHPVTIVSRGTTAGLPISRLADTHISSDEIDGRSVQRAAARCRTWQCRTAFKASRLETGADASPWAVINGKPVITERHLGRGVIYTLGFHPSAVRDKNGSATALLHELLVEGCRSPLAWLDFSRTMVLRMDDPGTAQNVYSRLWTYPELNESQWIEIGDILRAHDARLSIGYASGWVDDGDNARGSLFVDGHAVERVPGRVHDAPLVVYHDRSGTLPGTIHDFAGEYHAICSLRKQGLVDVELHGYTHMHPDSVKWAGSDDRYEAKHWYRELGSHALPAIARLPQTDHPVNRGVQAIQHYFGPLPTTLISPGDEWTNEALERALDAGLSLVSSYYLALRHGDHLCWSQHICAPYLDEPDDKWFDSGLPVTGYFHDREPSVYGTRWLAQHLDSWKRAGAQRFIDFRELACAIGRTYSLEDSSTGPCLVISGKTAPPLVRPLPVKIRMPDGQLPSKILVSTEYGESTLDVVSLEDGIGEVLLPTLMLS
jgi:hypothetical protein